MTDELARLDATDQAALVRKGEVTPLELVDAAIARIEAIDPQLDAVIHERFEAARAEASGDLPDGPFRGVPMVLKDLDGFAAGEPYHAGNRHLRSIDFRAPHDSWLTERFRAMGAVVVGRTNTPELGLLPSAEPLAYGPSRNPWDLERSPAGSSGGSAAAVAAGLVPLGHAGDGGGSIRLPASVCGLVGLKPSRGRVSLGPEAGEAWSGLVSRLVVTRSVRDTAGVLEAVHGPMPGDPYAAATPDRPYTDEVGAPVGSLRIGWTTTCPDRSVAVDPEVAAATEDAARLLGDLGHRVDAAHPRAWDDEGAMAELTGHFLNGMAVWTAAELDRLAALAGVPFPPDGLEPHTAALAEMGRAVTGLQLQATIGAVHASGRALAEFWAAEGDPVGPGGAGRGYDVLVTPVVPELPWLLGQFGAGPDSPLDGLFRASAIVPFTVPFNVSGQPAVSVPLGWSASGLPIGVQLVADHGREDLLLRLAAQLEEAAPWSDRLPPVHA